MDEVVLSLDRRKILELYRQIMNVLQRNNATTEEGFTAVVTALKTITENDLLDFRDRQALRKKVIDAMEAEYVGGPTIIKPVLH